MRAVLACLVLAACGSQKPPAPSPIPSQPPPRTSPTTSTCGPQEVSYFAPGCTGPAVVQCRPAVGHPAENAFCGCDGKTIETADLEVPSGVRYAFEGRCAVTPSIKQVAVDSYVLVVGHDSPSLGALGRCTIGVPATGELGRLRSTAGEVSIRRTGNDVIASAGGKRLAAVTVPAAQRIEPVATVLDH